ncbi:MAG: cobalamin-dependent protein, partial [Candidatus Competibacteraceae bacterium]|nr:cobalamin-dependent protein [Candidatus Competibacteraceae bacterium]
MAAVISSASRNPAGNEPELQHAAHKIRFITAASLFDGHDASINIMRRILQSSGAEVIHLGHNRAVSEIVNAALQEDVNGIAVSSYQGGHVEYFKYMIDLLRERGGSHIKVFGGGGGVIVPPEIRELHAHGVTRIFSPEDGQTLGLQGMIDYMVEQCRQTLNQPPPQHLQQLADDHFLTLARLITLIENDALSEAHYQELATLAQHPARQHKTIPVLGITGTGGAGK